MQSVKWNKEVFTPSKIICVGRNYAAHIAELNNETPTNMVLFAKPNSAITDSLNSEHLGEALHYETELCFLVKDKQLAAVALGLDLTKRGLQSTLKEKGLPWERAKAFNGSALFTEFVAVNASCHYQFSLKIDGIDTQLGDTRLMLHNAEQILAEINEALKNKVLPSEKYQQSQRIWLEQSFPEFSTYYQRYILDPLKEPATDEIATPVDHP